MDSYNPTGNGMGIGLNDHQGDQVNGIDPLLNPLGIGREGFLEQNGVGLTNQVPHFHQEVQQISPNHDEEEFGLPAVNANGLNFPVDSQDGNIPENGDHTTPVEEKYSPDFLNLRSTNLDINCQ